MWVDEATLEAFNERIEQLEASNRIRGDNCAELEKKWAQAEISLAALKGAAYRRFNEAVAAVSRIAGELQQEIHDGPTDQ